MNPKAIAYTPYATGPDHSLFINESATEAFRERTEEYCEKTLPALLRTGQIGEKWKLNALYLAFEDEERDFGPRGRPWMIAKRLDKQGGESIFMLRKQAAPLEGFYLPMGGGLGNV